MSVAHRQATKPGDTIETRAMRMAALHKLQRQPDTKLRLLNRLNTQRILLHDVYLLFVRISEAQEVHSYAAEWLLDNYYIIQQALRQIRENMPENYYRQLPKLSTTRLAGYPRVYAIARELVINGDAHIETDQLEQFVSAYQTITPLTMGEIWAIPIMLRFSIIEALTVAATRALEVESLDEGAPGDYISADILPDNIIANCVTSLRALAIYDWKAFFERTSLVEHILGGDPSEVYPRMDFDTRDRYRKIIEKLSKLSSVSEVHIARHLVAMARQSAAQNWQDSRAAHVGYYLIAEGRRKLEAALNYKPEGKEKVKDWLLDHPIFTYLGAITTVTVLFLLLLLVYGAVTGGSIWQLAALFVLALIPASTIGVSLVNWAVMFLLSPRLLPRFDFTEAIPEEHRAMIVIPTLLTDKADIDTLLRQLELHYLRNEDPALSFALLTDFTDAPEQTMPEDEELLHHLMNEMEQLRKKYAFRNREIFFLFHRGRRYNPKEGVWMGWERKRGKLIEFNRLLLEQGETSFSHHVGKLKSILPVEYVITLDTDTVLPSGAAARLIGTMAHPLNKAVVDPASGQVTAGYSLLQPRAQIQPTSANRTRFSQIFTDDMGLDLYTHAVSDVYQDLFGEGIYVGKGIYDVWAFSRSLQGQIPENTLLSHDLLEGVLGRAGLVSDVVIYEEYPSNYQAFMRRLKRWIRGDWQLLPWLLSIGGDAGKDKRQLDLIDRWKIVDNLRRSLYPPTLLFLLVIGWLWLPGWPLFWSLVGLLISGAPLLTAFAANLTRQDNEATTKEITQDDRNQLLRWFFSVAFLPHEALISADAILTTLWRMLVTRRKLLEWTTSASVSRFFDLWNGRSTAWQQMGTAFLLAAGITALIAIFRPSALLPAFPFLLVWILSPEIVHRLNQPISRKQIELSDQEMEKVRKLARRTWFFFEQFVGPTDHWLAPDHFQESPRGTVAHRTSATNIGLGMLSTLAAYDLGYISLAECLVRLSNTMETLDKLEKFRGHILNWYDTRTLAPLPPRYVSTVDSGNLAGCMITLSQGLLEVRRNPMVRWQFWEGILDTLGVFKDTVETLEENGSTAATQLCNQVEDIINQILEVKSQPGRWPALWKDIIQANWPDLEIKLVEVIEIETANTEPHLLRSLRMWADRVHYHINMLERNRQGYMPWIRYMASPPDLLQHIPPRSSLSRSWQKLVSLLDMNISLEDVIEREVPVQQALDDVQKHLVEENLPSNQVQEAVDWCSSLSTLWSQAVSNSRQQVDEIMEMSRRLDSFVRHMDFKFLYNAQRHIFHIGYNLDNERLDNNYYDLLASESRIASLIAIAKDDVPERHWLFLGRPLTRVEGKLSLLSWSGTMFEYLMPPLLMREHDNSLLDQSSYAAIRQQINHAASLGIPWGISESGFYYFDANQNYQYRAFGVPGLGFKRGLSDDLVIAPYASLMALPFSAKEVVQNMDRLVDMRALTDYGFYEAIDFTPERLPLGQEFAIVRSFMAHHQGMVMLAIANYLQDHRMVDRFHANSRIQSVEMLLQEQIPDHLPVEQLEEEQEEAPSQLNVEPQIIAAPWRVSSEGVPLVHYLSNGRYSLLITSKGGGYSRWQDRDLTRWRADTTVDNFGSWIYLKDLNSGEVWTPSANLIHRPNEQREVFFAPHKVDFHTTANGVNTHTQVTVSPDEDLEVRRMRLINTRSEPLRLAITSYGEVILTSQDADRRHPAFNKIVIECELYGGLKGIIFRRRPRAASDTPIYLMHALVFPPDVEAEVSYESSRIQFLGRGRTPRNPQALEDGSSGLTGSAGPVLDPIYAVQGVLELPPHESVELAYLTLAADSRQAVLSIARRYQDWRQVDRIFDRGRYSTEIEMRRTELTSPDLEHYQKLLSTLLYPQPTLRADPQVLGSNSKGQPGLWAYGISGDYPILLITIGEHETLSLLREVLHAHAYWRSRGLLIDLVILTEKESGYGQEVHNRVHQFLIRTNNGDWLNRRGGIYLLRRDQMLEEDQRLIFTVARAILNSANGPLDRQIAPVGRLSIHLPQFVPVRPDTVPPDIPATQRPESLLFDNGIGGFTPDGKEYQIYLEPGKLPPAPWINVIANAQLGFWVSEAGGGYTWALNSGENRLTPWSNDPVSDTPGEALYLRDEETAEIWSPTPLPAGANQPYLARHGAGYTVFEHNSHGLEQTLSLFTARDEPVKVVHLRLTNHWQRVRRITATYYAEWVMGVNRDQNQMYVISEYEAAHSALLASNPYNTEFGQRVSFLAASQEPHGITASRSEFIGRSGSFRKPAALERVGLSGITEAGIDPCAAIQLHLDIQPGETEEIFFLMGQGADREESLRLIKKYQSQQQVNTAFEEVTAFWNDLLSVVQVKTPDPALDLILNRWLLYQDLSCRVWGRSALYQSSGAFGFRDQLQDVMALTFAAPEVARKHILLSARHQFTEGDVLHWWHPPSGRGVRTRHSDDLLWLPYVVTEYLQDTGDFSILQEGMPFMVADPLKPEEEDRYGYYPFTEESFTLYEHCRRAILKGSTTGPHGLPLIGTGDWNDGMNRVGVEGKGESIWLGWFLYAVLDRFEPICRMLGDEQQAEQFRQQAERLKTSLQEHAWDGEWYLRAFYDNGLPLGSRQSTECKIDSIAQSWAVLSGAGDPARNLKAMDSVFNHLVQEEGSLLRLFKPSFDQTPYDPGYIKAYPPGIRENGGQYTHAAIWTVWAYTVMGQGSRAVDLFRMLNPIYHGDTPEHVAQYRVEPYIIAADVYSDPPHTGHGGWTWYTGSGGWMYRLGLEAILGLRRLGDRFTVDPCISPDWPSYQMEYRFGSTRYQIQVLNPEGVSVGVGQVTLDSEEQPDRTIPLLNDGQEHQVVVRLSARGQRPSFDPNITLSYLETKE